MIETLKDILKAENIDINEAQLKRIEEFNELLSEKNKVMDLTNITEPKEVAVRHMADSLFLLKCTDFEGKKVADIGTGAGFPGMPLLMYMENLNITMVDSTQKRIDFINETIEKIGGCPNAKAIAIRAEELGIDKKHREKYDVVTSRAVAPFNILAELCLPLLKKDGIFLAMKSSNPQGEEEKNAAKNAISVLGGEIIKEIDYAFTENCPKRQIVVVKKIKATPPQYPRKYAKIKAKPL